MSGFKFDPNAADLDITSLEHWKTRPTTKRVVFPSGYGVVIRILNQFDILAGDGDAQNPLLAVVAEHVGGKSGSLNLQELFAHPEKLNLIRNGLRDMMVKLIVSPPLLEQGNPEGIPISSFTLEEQMQLFQEAFGGKAAVDAASNFPAEQGTDVEITSD